jgi:bacteriorhodopsin
VLPDTLTKGQYDTVYNLLSLVIASQLFTALFLVIAQPRVLARYRQALVVSAMVCGIAAYHYFRIFASFKEAFVTDAVGGRGVYGQAVGRSFNEGYRYVDWLLTVPLLLVELVVVLTLAKALQSSLLHRLIPAAAAMIILGYPGEISSSNLMRHVFGLLSTVPFLYILYVLFVELTKSLDRQPAPVRRTVSRMRILLVATWGVYPIAYLVPLLGFDGASAWVGKQAGYSIADILAKAFYGLLIFRIARLKSFADDPLFAALEESVEEAPHAAVRTPGKPESVLS